MINSPAKVKLNRLKRTMLEGSPKYHYDVAAIVAGAVAFFDIPTQFPEARKYTPLDSCLIINNDAVNISVTFNGAAGFLAIVPAGVIRRISKEEVGAINSVTITNLDALAAVTVNLIDLEIWKAAEDADSVARRSL